MNYTARIVPIDENGFPKVDGEPVLGDLYLTETEDGESYMEWTWTGNSSSPWSRIGELPISLDEEQSLREQRVENVKKYFKDKRQRLENLHRSVKILQSEYVRRTKETTL